jgi:hypothetical protein
LTSLPVCHSVGKQGLFLVLRFKNAFGCYSRMS